ncbi:hypothetical protein [Anabaena azotica]|uniref:hypothetical protein n=1 Tax=Anabaena azotica TaxID=197653 RepID=UPI0039A453F0
MSSSPFTDLTNSSQPKPKNSDNDSNFNKWFLLTLVVSMWLVLSFNIVVDPYGIYKTPNFFGINHVKIQKNSNDRLHKAIDIIRIKPLTIFLGSSRTKQGLDPTHPALSNAQPAYNLGIDSANSYEMMRYLQHTLKNQPHLKQVIVGIDFFMFNELLLNRPGFDESRLEKTYLIPADIMNSLFSLDTWEVSKKTMLASLKEPNKNELYGENGFVPYSEYKNGKTRWNFKYSLGLYLNRYHYYKFSDKYFDDFQKIVNLCRENKIKLIVFISPSHATQWEAVRAAGKWEIFENWKRKAVQVTPVWDFSGYNTITNEPINDVMENYADNSHYVKPVGDLLLNRILSYQENEVPADFGVLVTKENIESHLGKIRSDREEWVKTRPNELDLVESLQRKFVEELKKQNKRTMKIIR